MSESDVIQRILAGERPEGADLSGLTLDGKRLPPREREVAWDLSGITLRGAVLTRLDLSGASFRGADLSGAAFRSVGLARSDFAGAAAPGAVFEDVNLVYSSFRDADLRGASFSYANLADISFKHADMRGASVNGVRFSLNGSTHALGLKEALLHRYGEVTYPFAAGVSGDAFWFTYLPESSELVWGGFPDETLPRGLAACGFESEIVNELDVEEAWRRLTAKLADGYGAITPVHIGGRHITGSGFGGSEWVYVSGFDPARNSVTVRCLLGDDLEFPWGEFVRSWCISHPLTDQHGRIVYTFCVVGDRKEEVPPGEACRRGIRNGLEILGLGEHHEGEALSGTAAYDLLLRDLDLEPAVGEGCRWLGLGLMHHHGSRWAIRDFLTEVRDHLGKAGRQAVEQALLRYEAVLDDLSATLRILPDSLESEADLEAFRENRDEASARIRSARSNEEAAAEALTGVS